MIKDKELFRYIERNSSSLIKGDVRALGHVIKRSCEIKAKIVMADEREETGVRSLLNFGHTIGHAIETQAGYGRFTHGEAVAIGMVQAVRISEKLLDVPKKDIKRVEELLKKIGLPVKYGTSKRNELLNIIKSDKKVKGKTINFVVMERIGKANLYKVEPAILLKYLSS